MANSPRPGVIQLEHPNVYQAAKQAQQDNWIRQGLKTTGDLIAERNKDIRYNKAMGKADDRRTSKEAIADTASDAWEGIKSGASSAWDLLKAPFAEEDPRATTTAVQYRREEGAKRTSPIPENPEDIIERPEDVLNAPDVTTEVDGLPSTQKAAPAERVTFPTTVVDFAQRTNFPTSIVQKPAATEQNAPAEGATGPTVAPGMLQAPDWSEMFRLDPKRAEYDWGRERDLMTDETRKRTASRNVQEWRAANAEHDRPIRTEMETKAIDLYRDVQNGVVKKGSDEYYERRKEIANLNAQLISRYPTTSFDRLVNEGVTDKKIGLQEEGMELNRDKEERRVIEAKAKAAENAAKNIMDGWSDILKKVETRATMLESYKQGVLEAIRRNSGATFAAALKQLIQSLDNSVVMAKEWGPFQSPSWLDQAKTFLEKQTNNTVFSSEEMRQSWVTAEAMADATLTMIEMGKKKAAEQVRNYPGLSILGVSSGDVLPYINSRLDAYAPISDFSVEPEWPKALDMRSDALQDLQGALGKGKGGTSTPTYGTATLEDLE